LKVKTHLGISEKLVGKAIEVATGYAKCELKTIPEMAADDRGLIHGGFIFGLADYAAMLAVNDPNVVLGASESRFLSPVKLGDVVVASATVTEVKGKKHLVECAVNVGEKVVFRATFTTFVLERHVLDS